MSSLNKIILIGRLTADPDVKVTTSGHTVANFTLAVDRPNNNSGTTSTDFLKVVSWHELAESVQENCKKGSLTLVEGRIHERNYVDNEGNRKWSTEIEARQIKPLIQSNQGTEASDNNPIEGADTNSSLEEKGAALNDTDFAFNDPFSEPAQNNTAETESPTEEEVPF
ncbi:single-stranded DNA-binding protein [Candidatus Marinamargulisbacteria bacterium SCGC AG-439-L15]|nr:single-stranded DNA-binding protein [Candidatus Marinamargulisbacteria bacterium SCGC AG-439-L15]